MKYNSNNDRKSIHNLTKNNIKNKSNEDYFCFTNGQSEKNPYFSSRNKKTKSTNLNSGEILPMTGNNINILNVDSILEKRKNSDFNSKKSRSKTVDSLKELEIFNSNHSNLKKKHSKVSKETLILKPDDIKELIQFKDWKNRFGIFMDKIRKLIHRFYTTLTLINDSYSWIEKRYLGENLKRIKKSIVLKHEV